MFVNYKNFILILFIAFLGGIAGPLFKIAVSEVSPQLFTFWRFFFAYIAFLPLFLKHKDPAPVNKKELIIISLLAVLNVLLFIFGVQYTTAINSGVLYAGGPLIIAILSLIILKEKISFSKWLGIGLGFLGLLVIILLPNLSRFSTGEGSSLGNLIILLAVVSFSLYSVISKKYQAVYSPVTLTKYFVVVTLLTQALFLLPSFVFEFTEIFNISLKTWLIILYAGILDTTLYYVLFQYVIKSASPVLASMTFYLQPVFGVLASNFLLGEKISPVFIIGTLFVFIGITFVFREQYRPKVNL